MSGRSPHGPRNSGPMQARADRRRSRRGRCARGAPGWARRRARRTGRTRWTSSAASAARWRCGSASGPPTSATPATRCALTRTLALSLCFGARGALTTYSFAKAHSESTRDEPGTVCPHKHEGAGPHPSPRTLAPARACSNARSSGGVFTSASLQACSVYIRLARSASCTGTRHGCS